ncbi:MAG: DUF1318 domain-containing protein [Deltaproteobacteria bacterium]
MSKIARITFQFAALAAFFHLASCAIVTVNIYFPAEEVKDAYKSLEGEFLKSPAEEAPKPESKAPSDSPKAEPQALKYPDKPQLESRKIIRLKKRFSIDIAAPAWATDNISAQIIAEIRKMPDVLEAFRRRSGRLEAIGALSSAGKAGEGNKGLLIDRGALAADEAVMLKAENADRAVIIRGMAMAIVKINKLDSTPENIESLIPQAGEQFAAVRREEARAGWEVQLPNGNWVKK